jgi:hypothetical protein
VLSSDELRYVRNMAAQRGPFSIADAENDAQWARLYTGSEAHNNYYDYYYSGQDVRVYVAELGDDPEFGEIPITQLNFKVEQEKAPLYGFWSFVFDSVMRGTRVVSGSLVIPVQHAGYMKELLAAAANARSKRLQSGRRLADAYPSSQGLTEDDANINQYWGRTLDHSAIVGGSTEWSIHPPFTLVVKYGLQSTSAVPNQITKQYNHYRDDNGLHQDRNQRLIEAENNKPDRVILEACELTSMTTQMTPEGQPLYYSYEFFARDLIVPPVYRKGGFPANVK